MAWWNPDAFEKVRPNLKQRMLVIRTVRRFLDFYDFDEVDTPILQVSPCAEAHLHGFKTELLGADLEAKSELYLHTSPEFAMKKLLVAGMDKIFQISHVFRNGEGSSLHSPEFMMVEWYRARASYVDIMEDCVRLLRYISDKMELNSFSYKQHVSDPHGKWNNLSVVEAFDRYADIDLVSVLNSTKKFASVAKEACVRVTEEDGWSDIFHAVMAEKIEPNLGVGTPTILYDYPVSEAALAQVKRDDKRFAERFELYVCGMELANAFGELTDAREQRKRYRAQMKLKKELYGQEYPIDEDFLKALEYGMPRSAGIALGLDRLAMLASGADHIENVLWCGQL
ncbi:MAG: EF-P lysine aminoacylase EpmA [Pseudomonadota bacterium]